MTRRINLALQGGGAHGAFTWGVLDRLLDEEEIEIAAISGTSAGALNGAALKAGLVSGGREGARENLDWLWHRIGAVDSDGLPEWFGLAETRMISRALEYAPGYAWSEAVQMMMSPYGWGPLYRNPLQEVVEQLDYERVCHQSGPRFFVGATRVRTGTARVFTGDEIDTDAILASACLPTLFRGVEKYDSLTGRTETFWDGGFTGNPPLWPLFDPGLPDDIVVVNINPLEREEVPMTAPDIRNRVNEISFNASLLRELRAIRFAARLIDDGMVEQGAMKRVRMHMIHDDELVNDLSVATKRVPIPLVMGRLKAAGRAACAAFLDAHRDDLGRRDTVDLAAMFG